MTPFESIARAKSAEDLFGLLGGSTPADKLDALRKRFHEMARLVHPDVHRTTRRDAKRAEAAFARLSALRDEAEGRIEAGVYGTSSPTTPAAVATIARKSWVYLVPTVPSESSDLYDVYRAKRVEGGAETPVVLQIVRDAGDSDLAESEVEALRKLVPAGAPDEPFFRYLPRLVDSFRIPDPGRGPRQALVLRDDGDFRTLAEVRSAYPDGVVLEDAVWMLNRMLEGLGFAHLGGLVHAAVVPPHVRIHPVSHGAQITDWAYAVPRGAAKARAVLPAWRHFYAPEILAGESPTAGSDVFMAARCVAYLLGGDGVDVPLPRVDDSSKKRAAEPFKRFLETCVQSTTRTRAGFDAWELRRSLDELMARWYGPRKYHPFAMPPRGDI